MTFLTIFTAPKPFTNPHINIIQRNALLNWKALGPEVEVIMVGDEDGMAEVAAEYSLRHLTGIARNEYGTPLISDIFAKAHQATDSPLLSYINADMLILPDYVEAAKALTPFPPSPAKRERGQGDEGSFLVVGQRYDLDVTEMIDFSPGWDERLRERVQAEGKLHAPAGSDYFIFPRGCYEKMPKFAVGRPMWDNWTIYHALRNRWPVINATQSVLIIHEDHDYSHLPGGQPPYRLPEAARNIRLAGGKRRAMYLYDTSHVLENGQVRPAPLTWKHFWRLVETFPILRLNSYALAEISYAIFHPAKALSEWRGRIVYKLSNYAPQRH